MSAPARGQHGPDFQLLFDNAYLSLSGSSITAAVDALGSGRRMVSGIDTHSGGAFTLDTSHDLASHHCITMALATNASLLCPDKVIKSGEDCAIFALIEPTSMPGPADVGAVAMFGKYNNPQVVGSTVFIGNAGAKWAAGTAGGGVPQTAIDTVLRPTWAGHIRRSGTDYLSVDGAIRVAGNALTETAGEAGYGIDWYGSVFAYMASRVREVNFWFRAPSDRELRYWLRKRIAHWGLAAVAGEIGVGGDSRAFGAKNTDPTNDNPVAIFPAQLSALYSKSTKAFNCAVSGDRVDEMTVVARTFLDPRYSPIARTIFVQIGYINSASQYLNGTWGGDAKTVEETIAQIKLDIKDWLNGIRALGSEAYRIVTTDPPTVVGNGAGDVPADGTMAQVLAAVSGWIMDTCCDNLAHRVIDLRGTTISIRTRGVLGIETRGPARGDLALPASHPTVSDPGGYDGTHYITGTASGDTATGSVLMSRKLCDGLHDLFV